MYRNVRRIKYKFTYISQYDDEYETVSFVFHVQEKLLTCMFIISKIPT